MLCLEVDNLWFSYDASQPVLKGLQFDVDCGEFLCILGPNGVGKTTFLKILVRLLRPERGGVQLFGRPLNGFSQRQLAGQIAAVLQNVRPAFPFTVRDVVRMGRYPHQAFFSFESPEDKKRIEEALDLTEMKDKSDRLFGELSSGEQQLAMCARALAQDTPVLVLDEPTANLDIRHQVQIFDLLTHLNRHLQKTILVITHDVNLAASYAKRILLVREGVQLALGSPEEVLSPVHLKRAYGLSTQIRKREDNGKPYVLLPAEAP